MISMSNATSRTKYTEPRKCQYIDMPGYCGELYHKYHEIVYEYDKWAQRTIGLPENIENKIIHECSMLDSKMAKGKREHETAECQPQPLDLEQQLARNADSHQDPEFQKFVAEVQKRPNEVQQRVVMGFDFQKG